MRVFTDHFDVRQVVALTSFEIVRIVRGSYFHHARSELRISQFVEDDRESRDSSAAELRFCRADPDSAGPSD